MIVGSPSSKEQFKKKKTEAFLIYANLLRIGPMVEQANIRKDGRRTRVHKAFLFAYMQGMMTAKLHKQKLYY